MQSLLLVDYNKNGNTKESWVADVKKEFPSMKASEDLMSRKRADSKQWGPDTHAACQQALCRMEANYRKLVAIQSLLEVWCNNDNNSICCLTWLDKVAALDDIPLSPAGEAITLRKQIEKNIWYDNVCGATIPTAYAYSSRFSPGSAFCPPPSLSPQRQGPYPP